MSLILYSTSLTTYPPSFGGAVIRAPPVQSEATSLKWFDSPRRPQNNRTDWCGYSGGKWWILSVLGLLTETPPNGPSWPCAEWRVNFQSIGWELRAAVVATFGIAATRRATLSAEIGWLCWPRAFKCRRVSRPLGGRTRKKRTSALQMSFSFCLVLIKKMHELRSSQVTPVEFESCHLHILHFCFTLFVFSGWHRTSYIEKPETFAAQWSRT